MKRRTQGVRVRCMVVALVVPLSLATFAGSAVPALASSDRAESDSLPRDFPDELPLPRNYKITSAQEGRVALRISDSTATTTQERLNQVGKAAKSYRKQASSAEFYLPVGASESDLNVTTKAAELMMDLQGPAPLNRAAEPTWDVDVAISSKKKGGLRLVITYSSNRETGYVTVEEAASRLAVSPDRVTVMLNAGDLGGVAVGKSFRVRDADIDFFLAAKNTPSG